MAYITSADVNAGVVDDLYSLCHNRASLIPSTDYRKTCLDFVL